MKRIVAQPLSRAAFQPFGDVISAEGWTYHYPINAGMTERYHDLATAEATGENARVILSLFRGHPYEFPLTLRHMERHPFGSQAFVPLSPKPYLVVVCADMPDGPGEPQAFVAAPGQGVNYPRNRWHAVLTPIGEPQDFLVVDRAGDGSNLEEYHFPQPYEVHLP